MSEATIEAALESEAFESAGEAAYEGEAAGEAAYEGEAAGEAAYEGEAAGEAAYEAYGEDARSDARRRERQRQIMLARQRQAMLARQRQAQLRRPPPARRPAVTAPSPAVRAVRSEVRSLDLETKVALDSLRSRLNEAHRLAYRNAWAAEASAAASQVLDSFENGLRPHDWARALIRGAPTLLIAPGKPRRPGIEGILYDPRVAGGALLAGIFAVGHFRNTSQGVSRLEVNVDHTLTVAAGANHTAQLTAAAFDKAGNVVPNATFTYTPQTPGFFSLDETSPGVATLTGIRAGTTFLTVTAGGKTGGTFVTVTPAPAATAAPPTAP
jgi:hypothetical protein